MNKTLSRLLAIAGLTTSMPLNVHEAALAARLSHEEVERYARFRARQKQQRREAGSMRRSNVLLDLVQGKLERGTRAKNRGPYPQHMIANCAKMHERNTKRPLINGKRYSYSELELTVGGEKVANLESINYMTEGHS